MVKVPSASDGRPVIASVRVNGTAGFTARRETFRNNFHRKQVPDGAGMFVTSAAQFLGEDLIFENNVAIAGAAAGAVDIQGPGSATLRRVSATMLPITRTSSRVRSPRAA